MKLTDEELTRLAAEKVMGWPNVDDSLFGDYDGPFPAYCGGDLLTSPLRGHAWHPLTDWRPAGEIVDKMRADGWDYRISSSWEGRTGVEFFDLTKPYSDDDHMTYVDSGPRAITIAALLAVGAITEDQC